MVRNRNGLMNAQSPYKWWSTHKPAVSRSILSFPPLVVGGGGLAYFSVGKTDLQSNHFDSKQSRESVDKCSLATRLLVLSPLPSGRGRSAVSY